MGIHEQVGSIIAKNLEFTQIFGLRLQDYGELAVTTTAAVLLLIPIGYYYSRASNMFRNISRDLVLLLLMLGFFGIFLDMVGITDSISRGRFLLGMTEDGGEMIAISVVTWYVFLLYIHEGHADFSLGRLFCADVKRRSNTL